MTYRNYALYLRMKGSLKSKLSKFHRHDRRISTNLDEDVMKFAAGNLKKEFAKKEGFFVSILDNLQTAVVLVGPIPDLRIEYLNPAAEILFGSSTQHALGQSLHYLFRADVSAIESKINQSFLSGRSFSLRGATVTLQDFSEITIDCAISPIMQEGNESCTIIEMSVVDSQLKISRQEMLKTEREATHEMIRGVAHEIKNPLGGLRGAAQLLHQELKPKLQEYTKIVINEADRLHKLVDSLLGPNNIPKKSSFNIHEITEHVSRLINAQKTENISITKDYDPSLPEIYADKDMIIQALLNIAKNALYAVDKEGGGEIKIKTRVERNLSIDFVKHPLLVAVEIIDTGPGLADTVKEKIFFPLVTDKEGGAGLGLSIAQRLVTHHDGSIEYIRANNETIFKIILPVNQN